MIEYLDNIYFLTFITRGRRPILIDNAALLLESLDIARDEFRFKLMAWVVLPDHIHLLVDTGEARLPRLIRKIKVTFADKYRVLNGISSQRIWASGHREGTIETADDLERFIDYLHYNPVRHGVVQAPVDYEYSSFNSYVGKGFYGPGWGVDKDVAFGEEFDEFEP
jgi:putative transposase